MKTLEKTTIVTAGNNIEYFSISYKGDFRDKNEDYYKNEAFKDTQIFLITGGMGGCEYGEKTSEIAVEEFLICFKSHFAEELNMKDLIYGSIHHAGHKILDFSSSSNCPNNIGITFLATIIRENTMYLFNIGDSRAYLQNEHGFYQISKDHVVKNNENLKNAVTRGLGFKSMDKPDHVIKELSSDDQILTATNGFYKFVDKSNIQSILKSNLSIKEKCNKLLEDVINKSNDNITTTLTKI